MEEDYILLGINYDSSLKDIDKEYKKKVKILHPDKGGNATEFNSLKEAYDRIIKEKKKREGMVKGSFNDSFLQRDYMNLAFGNRYKRMDLFRENIEKELLEYTNNFYSETTNIIEINGKKIVEKKINNNGKITIERYSYDEY